MKTRPNASMALFALQATIVVVAIAICSNNSRVAAAADFGPSNPFIAPSSLLFHAPPFDRIRNEDFQSAIEAGIAQQEAEVEGIGTSVRFCPPARGGVFPAVSRLRFRLT